MAINPESAREYLRRALAERGIEMKAASEAVGRNHAYIQQYLARGKPTWLPEPVREALVKLYGLDGERLRPAGFVPALRPVNGHQQRHVHIPRFGKFVDDPRQLELLDLWAAIRPDKRELVLEIMRNLVDRSVPIGDDC